MSIGQKRPSSNIPNDPNDWLWSDQELDLAEAYLEREVTIDSSHDVPYTAGYSQDGKTVYIDKEVPKTIECRSNKSRLDKVTVNLYKSFAFHETVEKSLEDEPYFLPYLLAHQIALREERMYVQSVGADWNDYNDQTMRIVTDIGNRAAYPNCPNDLDIQPYIDEDDDDTLAKMKSSNGRDFDEEEDEANAGVPGTDEDTSSL
jgi:hypothetical protein